MACWSYFILSILWFIGLPYTDALNEVVHAISGLVLVILMIRLIKKPDHSADQSNIR